MESVPKQTFVPINESITQLRSIPALDPAAAEAIRCAAAYETAREAWGERFYEEVAQTDTPGEQVVTLNEPIEPAA